jgi:epoxyqueuosine reductase QueG
MKAHFVKMIQNYIKEYEKRPDIATSWGEPLVGFADARHPDILDLKTLISSSHLLPADVLPNATVVVAYFVPFTREIADTNRLAGDIASPQWALAYEETNAMFRSMNAYLIDEISAMGYQGVVTPEAFTFDQNKLISNWSQRHLARIAGLETFASTIC